MDKFYKSIKFVNLLEQNSSCYLTACEDKKSVTLVRKHDGGGSAMAPKGAEWRLKWVQGPTGVLTGKFRLHSIYHKVLSVCRVGEWPGFLKVYQDRLPRPDEFDTAIEWSMSLKQISYKGFEMEAQLIIEYEQVGYFLAGPQSVMCNYDRFASPRLEPLHSACRMRKHNWLLVQLFNTEQQQQKKKQKQLQQQQQQQQQQQDDSKKAHSTNNNNSVATTTTTTVSREVAFARTAVSNNGQASQLTGWQVGQVVLNYFYTGSGGGLSNYNAGQNVNGSGTQTNGEVNVHTELGSTRQVSVNFSSNKS